MMNPPDSTTQSSTAAYRPQQQSSGSAARLILGLLGAVLFSIKPALGGPILSEIHYNGIASGSDPDEFIELSNPGEVPLELGGWKFTQGIDYIFPEGTMLAPAASLVLARELDEFLGVFPDFVGDLFDFSGALSNSGETLTLADRAGIELWSVSYDDRTPWPRSADGLGSSLGLIYGSLDASIASNWQAQTPSPGIWGTPAAEPSAVATPASIFLLGMGGLILAIRPRGRYSVFQRQIE